MSAWSIFLYLLAPFGSGNKFSAVPRMVDQFIVKKWNKIVSKFIHEL